jgi:hypothetical protein
MLYRITTKRIWGLLIIVLFFYDAGNAQLPVDPTGYFNLGSTQVTRTNGKSYPTDTIGWVCSSAETGTYGGWIKNQHDATGFFYVDSVDGNWYIVDPEGYEFIAKSVVSVEKGGPVMLPDDLKQFSINSMGNWSDLTIRDIPVCPRYNFLQSFKNYAPHLKELYDQNIFPVFEPSWPVFCNSRAGTFVDEFLDNPWVIGYFTDNELAFHKVLLDDYLALDESNANYIAARDWMIARSGEGFTVSETDREAFRGHVARAYASAVYNALKSSDPNHMVLGPRLHASAKYNPYILQSIGAFVDVMGINFYSRWEPSDETMDLWLEEGGKPFLITEFYTKAKDTGLPNASGAGWEVYTQQDRAWFFENFVLQLMSHPGSVGWQWFRYIDKDGVNKGIISTDYTWYEELTSSMYKVGKDVYNLRRFLLGLDYDPAPDSGYANTISFRGPYKQACRVYPNPAGKEIIIHSETGLPDDLMVSIYHVSGHLVYQHSFPGGGTEDRISISCSEISGSRGIFFFKLEHHSGFLQGKILIL